MKTDIVHREEAPKIWTFNDDLAELVEGLKIGWGGQVLKWRVYYVPLPLECISKIWGVSGQKTPPPDTGSTGPVWLTQVIND